MSDIRPFIKNHLLEPLKNYPTIVQDTMIEIITQRLQRLYEYTVKFPEIVTPNKNRLDILKAIADQFLFTVRSDASIDEQIDILDNILYVYSRRGSIDTIENMWTYYGGTLPKDVKVLVPSQDLFRYSMSALSGTNRLVDGAVNYILLDTPASTEVPSDSIISIENSTRYRATPGVPKGSYQVYITTVDGLNVGDIVDVGGYYKGKILDIPDISKDTRNRPGVYEIRLTNNSYPIPELRNFLLEELVAAGNLIYFTNSLHLDTTNMNNLNGYLYNPTYKDSFVDIQLPILKSNQGLTWSGNNPVSPNSSPAIYTDSSWRNYYKYDFTNSDISEMTKLRESSESLYSGRGSIFLELSIAFDINGLNDEGKAIPVPLDTYRLYNSLISRDIVIESREPIAYSKIVDVEDVQVYIDNYSYCTPSSTTVLSRYNLQKNEGTAENPIWVTIEEDNYVGYFRLGTDLLDDESEWIK